MLVLVLGLIILIAAAVVGAVAVLDNRGVSHQLPGGFHAFGRVLHGSSGQLFFWGAVVGGAAMLGLFLLLAGLRRDLKLRAQVRRDGVRGTGSVRRGRRVRGSKDIDTDADYNRDGDSLPASETETTRDRESERLVSGESADGADGDAGVKA